MSENSTNEDWAPKPWTPDQEYAAAMQSVRLINAGKPEYMKEADWQDCLERNKEHLRRVIAKEDFWTDQDLTPLITAIGR